MGSLPASLQHLIETLGKLPGVGRKTAERFAFFLVGSDSGYVQRLVHDLQEAKRRVLLCQRCCNLSERDPCAVCSDARRKSDVVCVVERPAAVQAIEESGAFDGTYHVLHGTVSALEGEQPQNLKVKELVQRVRAEGVREVVVATNHNVEGDATAHYLHHILKGEKIKVTRLASGLPIGSSLVYADGETLARALSGRAAVQP